MHGAAVGRVVEHHHVRSGTAVTPVIGNNGPEVAGFRFPPPRIEHRRAGFIHEHPVSAFQPLLQVIGDRAQMETGAPHPVAERRPIQGDPLPGIDFGLTVEWKASRARRFLTHALPEPYVNLSAHTAPSIQPFA